MISAPLLITGTCVHHALLTSLRLLGDRVRAVLLTQQDLAIERVLQLFLFLHESAAVAKGVDQAVFASATLEIELLSHLAALEVREAGHSAGSVIRCAAVQPALAAN